MGTKSSWKSIAAALLTVVLAGGETRAQAAAKAPPQDAVATRIAQAQLAEQTERDFVRATELWRAIAEDTTVDVEKRGQAWIAVARNLQRLGKAEEAKQALDSAEALGGKAAEAAKRVRASGADERVTERVKQAIATLVNLVEESNNLDVIDFSKPPAADLLWLGEAAVPGIAEMLEVWIERAWRVSGSVRVLVAIGGDAAASNLSRLVASRDPVVRRAVLEGADTGKEREPVRSALLALCDDGDARVRAMALKKLMPVMTQPELLARSKASDDETRARAIDFAWKLEKRDPAMQERGVSPELIAALRTMLEERSERVQKAVQIVLEDANCLRSTAGRELWLDALASEGVSSTNSNGWTNASQYASTSWFEEVPPASRLLEVARAIDRREKSGGRSGAARNGLSEFVRRCTQRQVAGGVPEQRDDPWPNDHVVVFELARTGCWDALALWMSRHARLDDLPELVSLVALNHRGAASVAEPWLARVHELPPAKQQHCIDLLTAAMRSAQKGDSSLIGTCFAVLAALGLPAADAVIVDHVRDRPEYLSNAWSLLIQRDDPPPSLQVFADLLVIPEPTSNGSNGNTYVKSMRARAIRLLATAGDPRLPGRIAAGYQAGLPQEQGNGRGTLIALFADPVGEEALGQQGQSRRWAPRYSGEELARAIVESAATGAIEFWLDLRVVIDLMPRGGADDDVAVATSRAIGSILAGVSRSTLGETWCRGLVAAYVGASHPGWIEFALGSIDDPQLADAIVRSLPSMPEALLPRVVARTATLSDEALNNLMYVLAQSDAAASHEALLAFLKHDGSMVRQKAVAAIASEWPERIVALVGPLAKDRNSTVRFAVAKALVGSFDREAIPLLVELLRDSSVGVRGTARESLDQLQYYFDSKLRWERLLSESGIDANNAAEALLKQARSGATAEVRKAAIDSLGTLKVPEALPFLIELMADPDPTLAAAARAAITKINQ